MLPHGRKRPGGKIESMPDYVARLDLLETHLQALEFLLKRLPLREYIWGLSSSGGLRLQGVDDPLEEGPIAYLAMDRTEKAALICQVLQQAGKVN